MSSRPAKRRLKVVRAEVFGMCFGVRDALDAAFARNDAEDVTIYGELVHNETVLDRLRGHGYRMAPETGRESTLETQKVLVTAHGLSNRETERLENAGHELLDTTCPLVQRAHNAALRLQEAGYHPIVVGKPGHVEVTGLTGDLDSYTVVCSVAEAEKLVLPVAKLGVLSQTTFSEPRFDAIVQALRVANPRSELRVYNTVCEPTRQRRRAVAELARAVDVVVVVGGQNSNNSHELVRVVEEETGGVAHLVEGPGDLDPDWFSGAKTVGLTAGTSTLDEVLERVEKAIRRLPSAVAAGSPAP